MSEESGNVYDHSTGRAIGPSRSAGGDPPGGPFGERLARLETKVERIEKDMATEKDIANLKVWVLLGVIAGMIVAASLAIGILKLFP